MLRHCDAMQQSVTLSSGALSAVIEPFGARLVHLSLRGGPNMVLVADPVRHPGWHTCYPGVLVGPLANRVRGGVVRIGGHVYQMDLNEDAQTALHSGTEGLHARMWEVVGHQADRLCLACTLPDGACGLPGLRHISATFLLAGATFSLAITATTTAPTPINIAHHPYWRLGTAADHQLMVLADHYLPVDDTHLPTGEIAPVTGTDFDFRSPRALPPGIDHNLCLSSAAQSAPRPIATLTGTDGLRMRINSTEAGLQVYTGAFLPRLVGTDIGPLVGIALEPQGWPDAVNQPGFPETLILPDRPYRQITEYCFDRAP
jgi:aldose 1-epimerase